MSILTRDRGAITKRRENAKERQDVRNGRSHTQQLKVLDQRLGKGNGAKKERHRLLHSPKKEVVVEQPVEVLAPVELTPEQKQAERAAKKAAKKAEKEARKEKE